METFLIALGLLLAVLGLLGCLFPIVPGPPLSLAAIFLLSYAKNWTPFDTTFLIVAVCFTAIVVFLDYGLAALGAKKFGASKAGVWGSVVGMLAGIFFLPPFGMLLGAIAGALAGELLIGKSGSQALRAGWGVLIGNIFGTGLKLAFCGILLFFYLKEMV